MRLPILAALLSVGPVAAADPPSVEELFPLSAGRSWTYKVLTGPGPGQPEKFVVRVKGEEMVGDATCFRLEAWVGDRMVSSECVGATADGLCRFKIEKEEVVPPVPFLKPLKNRGKTQWDVPSYRIGTRSASATFTADPPAEMTVKAGKFKAIRVVAESREGGGDGNSRKTQIWYAPGVGIVKQQVDGPPRAPPLLLELESFEKGETSK